MNPTGWDRKGSTSNEFNSLLLQVPFYWVLFLYLKIISQFLTKKAGISVATARICSHYTKTLPSQAKVL